MSAPASSATSKISVNTKLADRAVSHQHFIERYKAGTANKVLGYFNDDFYPQLLAKIEARLEQIKKRGHDAGPTTTRRLYRLKELVEDVTSKGFPPAYDALVEELKPFSKAEAGWQRHILNTTVPTAVDFDYVLPSPGQVEAVVTARPFQGRLLRDWWKTIEGSTRERVNAAIRYGVVAGQTTDEIVRVLKGTAALGYADGVLEISRREIEAVTRTAVQHVSNYARQETYTENSDVLKGVQFVATLDAATCPICGSLDGEVFAVESGDRPPIHYNCRCTTVPVTKSWEELGLTEFGLKEPTAGVRKSMDGFVSEKMTYSEWLSGQSVAMQNEALGVTRAKLWRSGKMPIDRFVDPKGRLYTLEELYAREAAIFGETFGESWIPPMGRRAAAEAAARSAAGAEAAAARAAARETLTREISAELRAQQEQEILAELKDRQERMAKANAAAVEEANQILKIQDAEELRHRVEDYEFELDQLHGIEEQTPETLGGLHGRSDQLKKLKEHLFRRQLVEIDYGRQSLIDGSSTALREEHTIPSIRQKLERFGYIEFRTLKPLEGIISFTERAVDTRAHIPPKVYGEYLAARDELAAVEKANAALTVPKPVIVPGLNPNVATSQAGPAYTAEGQKVLANLPEPLKKFINDKGIKFNFGVFTEQYDPVYARQQPSGYAGGSNANDAGGFYVMADEQHIQINRRYLYNLNESTVYHELGHAVDHRFPANEPAATRRNRPSQIDSDFQRAYRTDIQAAPAVNDPNMGYFKQPGERGSEEAFAESFAGAYGLPTRPATFQVVMPRTMKWMREFIARELGAESIEIQELKAIAAGRAVAEQQIATLYTEGQPGVLWLRAKLAAEELASGKRMTPLAYGQNLRLAAEQDTAAKATVAFGRKEIMDMDLSKPDVVAGLRRELTGYREAQKTTGLNMMEQGRLQGIEERLQEMDLREIALGQKEMGSSGLFRSIHTDGANTKVWEDIGQALENIKRDPVTLVPLTPYDLGRQIALQAMEARVEKELAQQGMVRAIMNVDDPNFGWSGLRKRIDELQKNMPGPGDVGEALPQVRAELAYYMEHDSLGKLATREIAQGRIEAANFDPSRVSIETIRSTLDQATKEFADDPTPYHQGFMPVLSEQLAKAQKIYDDTFKELAPTVRNFTDEKIEQMLSRFPESETVVAAESATRQVLLQERARRVEEIAATFPTEGKGAPDDFYWHGRNFMKTKPSSGSNPGGFYETGGEEQWFIKFPNTPDQARVEVATQLLARQMGLQAKASTVMRDVEGHVGVGAPLVDFEQFPTGELLRAALGSRGLREKSVDEFVFAAWVRNWDAVGLEADNLVIRNGSTFVIDHGGSLWYRAQGALKDPANGIGWLPHTVDELTSFRGPKASEATRKVWGDVSDVEIAKSIRRMFRHTREDELRAAFIASGYTESIAANASKDLMARRDFLRNFADKVLGEEKFQWKYPVAPLPKEFNNEAILSATLRRNMINSGISPAEATERLNSITSAIERWQGNPADIKFMESKGQTIAGSRAYAASIKEDAEALKWLDRYGGGFESNGRSLWRGEYWAEGPEISYAQLKKIIEDNPTTWQWPYHVGASESLDQARAGFGGGTGVLFEIRGPRTSATGLYGITGSFLEEKEWIVHPGTTFRIVSYRFDDANRRAQIVLEEISDGR